jgi:cryptochrome
VPLIKKKILPSPKRRYLPVLRGFPAKYIYDPWNAPEGIQKVAKCLIGVNYPKPMVNHAEASRLNIERMKQIYQQLSRYRGLGMSVPITWTCLLVSSGHNVLRHFFY